MRKEEEEEEEEEEEGETHTQSTSKSRASDRSERGASSQSSYLARLRRRTTLPRRW